MIRVSVSIPCKICNTRRAKRQCPGIGGNICSTCCAEGREITIECPRECPHLREARLHESRVQLTPEMVPNRDIDVTEDFVRHHEHLVLMLGHVLTRAAEKAKAVDSDVREALEAIIQTYRTRQSGLIYESKLANPFAAEIQESLKNTLDELGKRVEEATGTNSVRDADVLGTLIFLQRLGLQHDNGRRRGRVFYDFLVDHFPAVPVAEAAATE